MKSLKPVVGNWPAVHLKNAWSRMTVGTWCDYNHYGTKGMFSPFAWAPWSMRGTIEQGSLYRPGIRCSSVTDAWRLYYGLKVIQLSDASGSTVGTPRWQGSNAEAKLLTRRVDPDLWLAWNHVMVGEDGYEYKKFSKPPLWVVTPREIKMWEDLPPVGKETHFMEDIYNEETGDYETSESGVRMWPWWYAETSGGRLTGAVYLQVSCGFGGRYYQKGGNYYAIQVYLGCNRYYFSYQTNPKTFNVNKEACGVSFELYGCYFATKAGNLGLGTPSLTQPESRFKGDWI